MNGFFKKYFIDSKSAWINWVLAFVVVMMMLGKVQISITIGGSTY